MFVTVMKIAWLNLRRDRTALALSFVLPILFFSVFASVFGAADGTSRTIAVALANEGNGAVGERLVARLTARAELRVAWSASGAGARAQALEVVRRGEVAAAIVIPEAFERRFEAGESAQVELLADVADPLAVSVVTGALNASALAVGYELGGGADVAPEGAGPLAIELVDVLGGGRKRPSIAYFAAGLGVLFLLFSVSNRSACFVDEQENGVLERLLGTRLTMRQLLLGRWLFLTLLGTAQVSLMFLWAAVAFGLPLWTPVHLAGFLVMTLATALTAAAFGLVLALLCRTREQLTATSIIVVLILSALGGSLFPRFLMPEALQRLGNLTFNAWALDGYQKVFWYEAPPAALWPEVSMLAGACAVFLACARLLARRWERA